MQSPIVNKSKTSFLKKEAILVAVIFAKCFCKVDLWRSLSQISQFSLMLVDVLDKRSGTGLVVSALGLSLNKVLLLGARECICNGCLLVRIDVYEAFCTIHILRRIKKGFQSNPS